MSWKLTKPLTDVCNPKAANQPMLCANPGYAPLLAQMTATGSKPIDVTTKQMLLTVLCAAKDKAPNDSKHPPLVPKIGELTGSDTKGNFTTIAAFNAKSNDGQRTFIDELWKRLVDYRIPDLKGSEMFEQDGVVAPSVTPLPTSIAPADPAAGDLVPVRRDARKTWARFGIGFRVEGGRGAGRDDMTRIMQQGPLPLLHNRALMRSLRGWVTDGAYIEQADRVFLWWQNEDVLNESATCVSRSLFGCTALPGRDTDTAAMGLQFHYLLAISCKNLFGCDTEAWQISRGADSVWRPGEKAFLGANSSRVIAWTKLVKQPPPGTAGGWRFMLPETKWNWVNAPDTEQQHYLEAELAAYRAGHWYNVSGAYDFAH